MTVSPDKAIDSFQNPCRFFKVRSTSKKLDGDVTGAAQKLRFAACIRCDALKNAGVDRTEPDRIDSDILQTQTGCRLPDGIHISRHEGNIFPQRIVRFRHAIRQEEDDFAHIRIIDAVPIAPRLFRAQPGNSCSR